MRYMIWNNKGGVGKTFLTYALATEYAREHPEKDVAVVDLCPQSNISEMLLGGNGRGEEALDGYYDQHRTIAGYIKSRYDRSRFAKLGKETTYFVPVHEKNDAMPRNLYLLPGDTDLDICAAIIDYLAAAPERDAWAKSRKFLIDLSETFEQDRKDLKRDSVFFYDCNPSFSNYTQLAAAAADKLIIPCTADSASIRGVANLFRLLYGIEMRDGNKRYDETFYTYILKAKEVGLAPPKIHSFIQNKSHSSSKKAASAYLAHIEKINEIAQHIRELGHESPASGSEGKVFNVKDGNTLASVINHTGLPLSKVSAKTYPIYGKRTQVNQSQLDELNQDIAACVASL